MIVDEDVEGIYKHSQENQKYLIDTERKHFELKWLSLSENFGSLRLWENDEIKIVSEDYYDDFIIEKAKKLLSKEKGFIPSARLIGEVYGHIEQYVSDQFLEYRLRELIEKGIFEFKGSLEEMRNYSIKFS
jgi:hypothetical protein